MDFNGDIYLDVKKYIFYLNFAKFLKIPVYFLCFSFILDFFCLLDWRWYIFFFSLNILKKKKLKSARECKFLIRLHTFYKIKFLKYFRLSVILLQWSLFWRIIYWTIFFKWKGMHGDRAIAKINDHQNSRAKTCFVIRAARSYWASCGVLQYQWLLSLDMLQFFIHKI